MFALLDSNWNRMARNNIFPTVRGAYDSWIEKKRFKDIWHVTIWRTYSIRFFTAVTTDHVTVYYKTEASGDSGRKFVHSMGINLDPKPRQTKKKIKMKAWMPRTLNLMYRIRRWGALPPSIEDKQHNNNLPTNFKQVIQKTKRDYWDPSVALVLGNPNRCTLSCPKATRTRFIQRPRSQPSTQEHVTRPSRYAHYKSKTRNFQAAREPTQFPGLLLRERLWKQKSIRGFPTALLG